MTDRQDPALLYDWLTQVRGSWGLSQEAFASLGVTPNGMRGWHRGSAPEPKNLAAFARALGIDTADLRAVMAGEDVPIPLRPDERERIREREDPRPSGNHLDERTSRTEARLESLAWSTIEDRQELRGLQRQVQSLEQTVRELLDAIRPAG